MGKKKKAKRKSEKDFLSQTAVLILSIVPAKAGHLCYITLLNKQNNGINNHHFNVLLNSPLASGDGGF